MRLLQRLSNGDIGLTGNLSDDKLPPYAILSHTWESDDEEVSFNDISSGMGRFKAGYRKIEFCSAQADRDGLTHFWVDSCCINKLIRSELQHAISSMFSWYQRSAKCYVFLSDVSDDKSHLEEELQNSRWFTRGWTLQELLAPPSVEFFSKNTTRLGDTQSLQLQICEITGIPQTALRGERSLSSFTVNERFRWAELRQTTVPEDSAYCLMGIFGVEIPVRYEEGGTKAFKRLENEIEKQEKCLQDLRLIDPTYHKKRIEHIKGGLLKESYRWILDNPDFRTWHDTNLEHSQALWIKGDPGKGKTMLLCGIIDELQKSMSKTSSLSYFFCEAADSQINTGTAVLRGLIYMLVSQQPTLISHIRREYDRAGKALFEDSNSWFALSEVFINILHDDKLNSDNYMIIDALDECTPADLPKLLDLIFMKSSRLPRVRWLVSSRNWPQVEEIMERAGSAVRPLCLELNAASVSKAVANYIQHKVEQLAHNRRYDGKTQTLILDHLFSNAQDTFLWVALVCEDLKHAPQAMVSARLRSSPPGLDSLYERMILQVKESKYSDLCERILTLIATVYEPVNLLEMASLVALLEDVGDVKSLHEVVSMCGSFLVIRDDRVYFFHQSARDYLLRDTTNAILPAKINDMHHEIFSRSLKVLSTKLKRNMYKLDTSKYLSEQPPRPQPDPLTALRYICLHWVDHLYEWKARGCTETKLNSAESDAVNAFIQGTYLYWLEAVSLCAGLSKGVLSMAKLAKLVQDAYTDSLPDIVHDALRFIMCHKQAIELSPLQTYVSALTFSPSGSFVRHHFEKEIPDWITIKPSVGTQWSASQHTLEGHLGAVNCAVWSNDSKWVASGSDDHTINIWDSLSGACLQTLKGHSKYVSSLALSSNSKWLASGSGDSTISIWDISRIGDADSGLKVHTLEGHDGYVTSVVFSPDSAWLLSASDDHTVKVWSPRSGQCVQTLEGHSSTVSSVTCSPDLKRIASGSHDCTVKLWDAVSGVCLNTLKHHRDYVRSVAFSHDSKKLASSSDDCTIKVWEIETSEVWGHPQIFHSDIPSSISFSPRSSTELVTASNNGIVSIWNLKSEACLHTLGGHSGNVTSVQFSPDALRLVSASTDRTVRIWDISTLNSRQNKSSNVVSGSLSPPEVCHSKIVSAIAFSYDAAWLASASYDRTIKIWDARNGTCLTSSTLDQPSTITSIVWSQDSSELEFVSDLSVVGVWDLSFYRGKPFISDQKYCSYRYPTYDALASAGREKKIGDSGRNKSQKTLNESNNNDKQSVESLALSSCGTWIEWKSQKLVWLPPEFRPTCSAISGQTIGLGSGSGKVCLCKIEVTEMLCNILSSDIASKISSP